MARAPLILGGLAALLVVVVGGYLLIHPAGRTPEGDPLLTAIPNAASFSPRELPGAPVLVAAPGPDLAVAFGYRVAGTSYSYTLTLHFSTDAEAGTATVTARHADANASSETPALRLWDAPRNAYAVALQDKFDMSPGVPALCLKALIGPEKTRYDLKDASICVAQRDGGGNCHPETLACGQIRAKS